MVDKAGRTSYCKGHWCRLEPSCSQPIASDLVKVLSVHREIRICSLWLVLWTVTVYGSKACASGYDRWVIDHSGGLICDFLVISILKLLIWGGGGTSHNLIPLAKSGPYFCSFCQGKRKYIWWVWLGLYVRLVDTYFNVSLQYAMWSCWLLDTVSEILPWARSTRGLHYTVCIFTMTLWHTS